jgi:hypothetical protein
MKKLVFCLVFLFANSAFAMTHFLVKQWYYQANQMCQYDNGTVLNVGPNVCPLTIQS